MNPTHRQRQQIESGDPDSGAGVGNDAGWTTAELLGNAALAIAALVALWLLLTQVGESVISWIQSQIM